MNDYTSSMPLFDHPREPPAPLNSTVEEQDIERLSRSQAAILKRLREGPATNEDLSRICQRFGGRLHELKVAGYPWLKRRIIGGLWEYWLIDSSSAPSS